jgi:prefoldin subunit 5
MTLWRITRKDVEKTLKDSLAYLKKRAETLSEEGKKRYRLYELKSRAHKVLAELGGMVYELSKSRRNPLLDAKVKGLIQRLKKLDADIAKLEGRVAKKKAAPRKTKKA